MVGVVGSSPIAPTMFTETEHDERSKGLGYDTANA